jgi:hypothetical protein
MVRTGPSKDADEAFANGRLANARAFLQAARDVMDLAGPGANSNPISTLAVNAAIGYTDALTAKFKGKANQQNHAAAPALLRAALGNRVTQKQLNQLSAILAVKDEVEYGPRIGRMDQAERIMEALEAFAAWAEETFRQ